MRERMTALAFLREFTRLASTANLAMVAVVVTVALAVDYAGIISEHGTMRTLTIITAVTCWGLIWWLLGCGRVQRWIRGENR